MLTGGEGAGGEGRNGLIYLLFPLFSGWGSRYGQATNWELGKRAEEEG